MDKQRFISVSVGMISPVHIGKLKRKKRLPQSHGAKWLKFEMDIWIRITEQHKHSTVLLVIKHEVRENERFLDKQDFDDVIATSNWSCSASFKWKMSKQFQKTFKSVIYWPWWCMMAVLKCYKLSHISYNAKQLYIFMTISCFFKLLAPHMNKQLI